MSKVECPTSTDNVYAQLMDKMHKGELLPGNSLDLKKLREELSVSSTPLSNALIRMEAEGFLTIYPRSRVVVNKLELSDFNLLYSIIGTIEFTLIAESIGDYSKETIAYMRELNQKMKEDIEQYRMIDYDMHHYEFHNIFTTNKENKFARRILDPIKSRLWDFPRKNFLFDWYIKAISEHEQIICAIESKDITQLANIIKDIHWGYEICKDSIKIEYHLEE